MRKGFEDAFSSDGPLAAAFDPEKNGVAESFRKFGADTDAAFKDLGEKMEKAFDPNQNGVADAFKKFGEDMAKTVGNDQWWRDTMSDPDTYIFIIGTIASVAAIVLSGGTAGPGVVAALSALGPSLNIINNAAQGRPVDPLDIAGIALAVIPGVGQSVGGLDDTIKAAAQAGQKAGKASQATIVGRALVTATEAAGKIGSTAIRTGVLARLDKFAKAYSKVLKIGNSGKAILNPKTLISILWEGKDEAAKAAKIPWKEMTKAQKITKLSELGVKVFKAGKYAKKVADYGQKAGLYTIPMIETELTNEGDAVDLTTLDPDNLPEDVDYVMDADPSAATPEEQAQARADVIAKEPEYERQRIEQGKTVRARRASPLRAAFYDKYGMTAEDADALVSANGPEVLNQFGDSSVVYWEMWDALEDPLWEARGPTATRAEFEVKYKIPFPSSFGPSENVAAQEVGFTGEEMLKDYNNILMLGGSGRRRKTSLVELNMSGAGFSEDLAYIGIDMSPLEGSGVPNKSWEAWYDRTSAENHAKKVALVKRRAEQRTVKIKPYTERPALLSDTFKVNAGRDIHGQIAGGNKLVGKPRIRSELPTQLQTTDVKAEKAVSRMRKAARAALSRKGGMKGGDWFKPSTWTWDSVNPANWSAKDWSDVAKGADAAVFGALANEKILTAALGAIKAGGTVTIPVLGPLAGETLAAVLTGAILAHEMVYPSCEDGEGLLGCNEYRKEVKEVVDAAVSVHDAYEKGEAALDNLSTWLTSWVDVSGDLLGNGAYRGAFTRGEPQAGEEEEKFYYPEMSAREARGDVVAGTEYAGPSPMGSSLTWMPTLQSVRAF
jgi:hypothetical protein